MKGQKFQNFRAVTNFGMSNLPLPPPSLKNKNKTAHQKKVASLINELLPKSFFVLPFQKNWMPLCSKMDFDDSQIRISATANFITQKHQAVSRPTSKLRTEAPPHTVGWVKWVLSPAMLETSSFTPKPGEPTAIGGWNPSHLAPKKIRLFLKKMCTPLKTNMTG